MKWIPSIVIGGVGLSAGASVVERLPASAASAGVNDGLASAGAFFPMIGTLGGASMTINQLKKLKEVK